MAQHVLLLTSSVYEKYINPQDHSIHPLFGDGATATYVAGEETETPFLHSFVFGTDGAQYDKPYISVGGSRNMPRENPEVFEMDERGNTRSKYESTWMGQPSPISPYGRYRQWWIGCWTGEDWNERIWIIAFSIKQMNSCWSTCAKKCGLMDAPFHNDIEKIGNTVSDTVPFGLEDVLRKQASQMLRNVLLAGFGVGRMHCGSEQNDLKGESCRCLPYGKHARMERKAS